MSFLSGGRCIGSAVTASLAAVLISLALTTVSLHAANPATANPTPPAVAILAPVDGFLVSAAVANLDVEVSFAANPGKDHHGKGENGGKGNVQTVILRLNGNEVGRYPNPPSVKSGTHVFNVSLAGIPDGEAILIAEAYQGAIAAGLVGRSSPVHIRLQRALDFDADLLPDDFEAQFGWNTNSVIRGHAAIGWWQMDAPSPTSVFDRSGNNLTGVLRHFPPNPYVSGLFYGALSFSNQSFVTFPIDTGTPRGHSHAGAESVLNLTNSFTMSLWLRATNSTHKTSLVTWSDTAQRWWKIEINPHGAAQLRFRRAPRAGSEFHRPHSRTQTLKGSGEVQNLRDNQWHHVAATYDAATSNAVLYVDGIAEATGVITNWNRTAPHPTATVKSFVFGFSPSLSRPGGDTIHHPPSTFPHNDDDEDDDESDSDDEDRAIASPSTIPAAADRNSPFSILHSSFLLDEARLYNIALSSNEILDLPNTFADPDNDGLSNLDEYRQGADPTRPDTDGDGVLDGADALPLDYYNGVLPNLAIVGGNNQSGLPETLLTEPLTVRVADTANQPLVSAPVTFAISQGGGQLAPMTNLMVRASSLAIRSSANGEASARFYLPAVFGTNVITVSAVSGTLTRSVQLTAVAEDPIPPEISILSPTNGLMTTNLVINLEGNVTDNDRLASVGVTFNTLALTNLVGLATNSMTLNIPLNLLDGTNTVDVVAQDRFGNTNAVSVAFVKGQLDSDGDGIPDDWEKKYFGDLSQDAQDDTDHDGLTNLEEFAADTDPTKTDTDGDGLPDAWEVNNGTNPLANDATADPDHDGVPNSIEFLQGRNPQKGAVADTTGAVSLQVYTLLE